MSVLNDIEKIREVDPDNMYNCIFDLPEQMEKALKIAKDWKINPDDFIDIKNIVVIGMGGSAIGGDLVRTYLQSRIQIPFQVVRNYSLPEYIDDESLVIASSYSGNTEETLSALDDAIARKAMITAISTGGLMEDICKFNEIPMAKLPEGMQPRAAIGYSFVPLFIFLEKVGIIKDAEKELMGVINLLKETRSAFIEDVETDKNNAKFYAGKLHGKMPIIYSGPTLTDIVAVRWKGQICENAKNMAFANHYAEFNHNELVGYADAIKKHSKSLIVVQLRSTDEHKQITQRMDIVHKIILEFGIEVIEINSIGTTELERMFYLIQLGDFISYYLAVLNKEDPSPVKVITRLKDQLAANKKK